MRAGTESDPNSSSPHFAKPHDVLADRTLSTDQKTEALQVLEQDARQVSEASSDGMAGHSHEKLHDVLDARDQLASAAVAESYMIVLRDLQLRQTLDSESAVRPLLDQAITALSGLAAVGAG